MGDGSEDKLGYEQLHTRVQAPQDQTAIFDRDNSGGKTPLRSSDNLAKD